MSETVTRVRSEPDVASSPVVVLNHRHLRQYLDGNVITVNIGTALNPFKIVFRPSLQYRTESLPDHDASPVLNTKSVKKLLEMASVRYNHDDGPEYFVVLESDTDRSDTEEMRDAFNAHGHRPREIHPWKLWDEYQDE